MFGTLVNAAAIIAGGVAGTVFNRSLPQRYRDIVFQGTGLFVIALGVTMAVKMDHVLLSVFALLFGGIAGELLKLDRQINALGEWFRRRFRFKSERFTEGFVSASLIYCVGAMAVLGAMEEGTGRYPAILLTKSVMDGFSAVAFSAALGIGVVFASIPVVVYQGAITMIFFLFRNSLDAAVIEELSATGGVLLIGLGISILGIKDIRVVNMLPALVFVVIFMLIF